MLKITTQYAQELINKQRHDAEMLSEELAYIQAEIALKKKLGESTVELQLKYQDKLVSISDEVKKQYEALVEENRKSYEDLNKQADDYIEKMLEGEDQLADQRIDTEKAVTESIQKIREQDLKKEQETLQDRAQLYQKLIETLSSAVYDFASDSEDGMRQFAKTILNFALDLLSKQVQIAVAGVTVQSLASAESVATYGAAGIAKAALLVGLIEAAFAGVKGLANRGIDTYYDQKQSNTKKGYYYGGFTPDGYWDQQQGEVHSGEFVANRYAVRNPDVRRFLDVFDLAQRSGQIRSLNTQAILRAVESRKFGYSTGGFVPALASPSLSANGTDPELKAMLASSVRVMAKLNDQLSSGIRSFLVYSDLERKEREIKSIRSETSMNS
ncbi:MAG TPA: hypothetical protein DC042_18525 [Bacteroidales bacterium]|nr:hypothetical protein [Bacteroidales bacterium]